MKIGLRFVFAALLIACVAALGFNNHVSAVTTSVPPPVVPTATPTPSCPTYATETQNGTLAICSASVDVKANIPAGGVAKVSQVNLYQFPPVPGQGNYSTGVNVAILDQNSNPVNALIDVCFPDAGGYGFVYRWVTASEWKAWYNVVQDSSWFLWPTTHKAGLTCAKSWVTGTFALHR
jgi:hypothetical protein